jgi:hypothetical protein
MLLLLLLLLLLPLPPPPAGTKPAPSQCCCKATITNATSGGMLWAGHFLGSTAWPVGCACGFPHHSTMAPLHHTKRTHSLPGCHDCTQTWHMSGTLTALHGASAGNDPEPVHGITCRITSACTHATAGHASISPIHRQAALSALCV